MLKNCLAEEIAKLKKNKIKFPHLEAEVLLSCILKKPREYIFAHPEYELNKKQVTSYKLQVTRRLQGVPIAYLTGEKEFYALKFFVNKNVLIPRPETEMMVDAALALIKKDTAATIIDVGTGSGCVIITLAKRLADFRFWNLDFGFYAIDVSDKALVVAIKNAKFHNVSKQIHFIKNNLLDSIPRSKIRNLKSKILITANLPYLTPAQIKKSPSIKFEPRLALAAGPDGLRYYRHLFRQIRQAKMKNVTILCEIDPSQKVSIKRLAKKLLPLSSIEIKKDLRGHSRLAIIKIA
jgi:release factor glutamine methyltransferase